MKMISVSSSSRVESAGYDEGELRFRIEYKDGAVWEYSGFPLKLFRQFVAAPSKGKFLNQHVLGKFEEKEIKKARGKR